MSREMPLKLTPEWTGRVLILKPSSLGDIVHALPVLSALRGACPRAHLSWLVRRELAPFLDCAAGLDEVILFDRKELGAWWYRPAAFGRLYTFLRTLRRGRYDLVLDLQGLLRTALFARTTGCRIRIGLQEAREGAVIFYTQTAAVPASPHIIDIYLEMAFRHFFLHADLLEKEGIAPKQFAVLIPGAAHQRKCWPPDRFARAAAWLHKEAGLRVVTAGSPGERAVADQIRADAGVPAVNLSGRTSLPQLAALLGQAALVLSNDTGPAHIAAALEIPTVVIFGPTNPARLGPYQKPESIAALDPLERGRAIDSRNPKYRIENVPVDLVMEKLRAVLPPRSG